jgi:hypothetical protein
MVKAQGLPRPAIFHLTRNEHSPQCLRLRDEENATGFAKVPLSTPFHKYGLVFCIRLYRRGRDSGYPLPPAQTRACGATAHGSYFGCAHTGSVEIAVRKAWRAFLPFTFPCSFAHTMQPFVHTRFKSHTELGRCRLPCCSPQSPVFPPPPPPSVSPLTLFGSFAGTTPMFDSSPACMHGLCFWLPVPIRRLVSPGCRRGLSVLERVVSRRAHGSWTTPGLMAARVIVPISVAFPLGAHGRRPNCVFRSSIPGPSMPLSTLHPAPRGTQRKTRGQDGSLFLSCGAPSSPTTRRFIPTIGSLGQ